MAPGSTLTPIEGAGHMLVRGDLRDPQAAADIVGHAVTGLGSIDVLVNNAAIAPSDSSWDTG